jgi:serine/threonine-protein kinase HipA
VAADRCEVRITLPGADASVSAGELTLLPNGRGSVFQYDPAYADRDDAIALDPFALELGRAPIATTATTREPGQAGSSAIPDAFLDASPDAWGRKLMDRLLPMHRRGDFDYLIAAGANRVGALDFIAAQDGGEPDVAARATLAPADLHELAELDRAIQSILAGLPVGEDLRQVLRPGTSLGGARPKALVGEGSTQWIAKFNARDERLDAVALEAAGMALARHCGLTVANTRTHALPDGRRVLLVERFDRVVVHGVEQGVALRRHYLSARTLMRGYARRSGEPDLGFGYPLLAEIIRLLVDGDAARRDMAELFDRMVFNILIDNADDHEKNHGLLLDGGWRLSPAFDVSPQLLGLDYQAMEVGTEGEAATLSNALSRCASFGLRREQALARIVQLVARCEAAEQLLLGEGVSREDTDRCLRTMAARVRDWRGAA